MLLMEEEIINYNKLVEQSVKKYGDLGIGTLMVRLHYLCYLIKQEKYDYHVTKELIDKIIYNYNYERIPPSTLKDYIYETIEEATKDIIYGFNREYFNAKYSGAFPKAQEFIKKITNKDDLDHLMDSMWYMYVINLDNELIIYNQPLKPTDLVLNRNEIKVNNVPIVHPILVHNKDLKIKCAGEITFIKDKCALKGVVFNTKSGHFRPNPNSSKHMISCLEDNFGLNEQQVITIPVGIQ